jgi:hypothetical protein
MPLRQVQADARSNAQTMTALGATSGDHSAPTLGAHANQETVSALTADNGRVIGAFHVLSLKALGTKKRLIIP